MTQANENAAVAPEAGAQDVHRLEQQRRENRDAAAALGLTPYGTREDGMLSLTAARARYDAAADERHKETTAAAKAAAQAGDPAPPVEDERPRVKVTGRVVLKREGGKLIWLQIRDHTTASAAALAGEDEADGGGEDERSSSRLLGGGHGGGRGVGADLQVAVSKRDVAEPGFEFAKLLDLGDVVVVEGPVMKTNKGEVTVWASALRPGTKALSPPPEKWSGLKDIEQRYRRRYVDLWANPESMRVLRLRSLIVRTLRDRLEKLEFVEVETPMLQPQAGGAAARPFKTRMNALDIDLYMRIAPELYLKRLLVGGVPRVFEINRNFRNEGLDKQHNPEFTMLELYEAFGDVESVMAITEGAVRAAARAVAAETGADPAAMPFRDFTVDYVSSFDRVTYAELFERALGFSMQDEARVRAAAEERGITAKFASRLEGEGRSVSAGEIDAMILVNELFEDVAEPTLNPGKPTWIMRYPAALSPLTRPNVGDPTVADRSDLFIGGMEVGPHYTELNDPDVQAARFREQLAGLDDEESTFRTFDADFIEALKVGMPPAGGMGLGIDRLCMLLLDQPTIRDVVLFPMMRPGG